VAGEHEEVGLALLGRAQDHLARVALGEEHPRREALGGEFGRGGLGAAFCSRYCSSNMSSSASVALPGSSITVISVTSGFASAKRRHHLVERDPALREWS
jgi:hypothetical protein